MTLLIFPKTFVWGAATASCQIEGYPLADGAGPSIWHRFSNTPGNIRGGHNEDLAYEHYHRYPEDIALMKSLGIQGYFLWTLMDNFEWAYGYDVRFGVTNVDHTTQKRTVKRSGKWYGDAISRNGVTDA
jgi:beta-glucosidase/6-phospho-beta-glucosidase/beta-galactosidase